MRWGSTIRPAFGSCRSSGWQVQIINVAFFCCRFVTVIPLDGDVFAVMQVPRVSYEEAMSVAELQEVREALTLDLWMEPSALALNEVRGLAGVGMRNGSSW